MRTPVLKVIFGLSLLTAYHVMAQSPQSAKAQSSAVGPDLFVPLAKSEEQYVTRSTNFPLRKYLLDAKRYRIVTVNFYALQSESTLSLYAFPDGGQPNDVPITLTRDSIAPLQENLPAVQVWKGHRSDDATPIYKARKEGDSQFIDDSRYTANNVTFEVMSEEALLTASQIKELRTKNPHQSLVGVRANNGANTGVLSGEDVVKVRLKVLVGTYSVDRFVGNRMVHSTYRVSPVVGDPRYHVIIESDPEKQLETGSPSRNAEVLRKHNEAMAAMDVEEKAAKAAPK